MTDIGRIKFLVSELQQSADNLENKLDQIKNVCDEWETYFNTYNPQNVRSQSAGLQASAEWAFENLLAGIQLIMQDKS